ncbi:cystinosin [Cinnamomum micranthum f. kanehirae]|uniref:Cystinosin n=1 Tax=Cinnamomum micranthum f. kanehirae TaxID=337451 RepID=A0A3S3QDR2_9MAGN|nr:cystinosin [Cinnamomum micranthum f. kanehirae]
MASWNSIPLEITYQVLGWLVFFCWTFGFYPQILLNYTRKRFLCQMIPVAANDVAFSFHAVLSKAIVIFQILIYERGSQKISKTCMTINSAVLVVASVCTIIAWPNNSWLWLLSVFK